MAERPFKSYRLSGRRLSLPFETIGDSWWTRAGQLRAMVAELDRLEVPDTADVRLIHRTDRDELEPRGWSLDITVPAERQSIDG